MDQNDAPSVSPKSYGVAVALSMIFGVMGVHHFYLGNWLHGLLDFSMLVVGIACIASENPTAVPIGTLLLIIDAIHTIWVTYRLLVGQCSDGQGRLVVYPGQIR
jgi:TM2 domain-containing membrane protein YozV